MNSNRSSTRPRFTCRMVRQWAALSGDTAPRHATGCADCREYFSASQSLEHALRRDALRPAPVMSPGFERRILNTVRASAQAPGVAPIRRGFRHLIPAGAGSLAVAALVVVAVWSNRGTHFSGHTPGASITREDAAAVVQAVQNVSTQIVETVIPSTAQFVANNPLQHEAESIYADARSALGFLALNFLPAAGGNPRAPSGSDSHAPGRG